MLCRALLKEQKRAIYGEGGGWSCGKEGEAKEKGGFAVGTISGLGFSGKSVLNQANNRHSRINV